MRRMAYSGSVLALALALAAPAWSSTQTYFGFHLGITNAPPPHVDFYDEPELQFISDFSVYVVDDYPYDMFRYGPSWYLCDAGYWYRSHSYRGPFRAVDVRYVPRSVLHVPASHWKHRYGRSWDRDRAYRGRSWDRNRGGRSWDRDRTYSRSWDRDRSGRRSGDRERGYRDRSYDRDRADRGRSWDRDRADRGRSWARSGDDRVRRNRERTSRARELGTPNRHWREQGTRGKEWRSGSVADGRDWSNRREARGRDRARGWEEGRGNGNGKGKQRGSRRHRDRG